MAKKAPAPLRSLIASAISTSFTEPLWNKYLSTDEAWMTEIWRLYDVVPEFSRGANWVGSCCSRVRIYVAEVDDAGQVQQEVKTKSIAGYAYSLFGGPERQADLLRLMGVDMIVSGEFWILGFNADSSDKWYAVSRNELKRIETAAATGAGVAIGGQDNPEIFQELRERGDEAREVFEFFDGRATRRISRDNGDIIYRCWTPHPFRTYCSDSPGRSLQMVLVELEILTQYILAQARSRLASAGVWIWPTGVDFPTKDNEPVNGESLMKRMLDAGEKNMKSFGSASQVLPMIVEMPEKVFDRIKPPIMFGSELSKEARELRKELRERLAAGMDIAAEIITGMGEATGWNTFSITADTVENVVKPIMTRICNAATEVYLKPALEDSGRNPKRYKYWFDLSGLTIRPQRLKETMELRELGVVGDDQVLIAADLPPSAAISAKESERDLARKLLLSDSNLILIPKLRELAGLTSLTDIAPDGQMPGQNEQPGIAGRAPAPPPPERTLKESTGPSTTPNESTRPGNPEGNEPRQPVAASMVNDGELALLVAADAACRTALERAGKQLLRRPENRAYAKVPHDQVYLHAAVGSVGHAEALVASGWQHLDPLMEHLGRADQTARLRETLTAYCVAQMTREDGPRAHEVRVMRGWLQNAGLL
jgi:hypothetical protein